MFLILFIYSISIGKGWWEGVMGRVGGKGWRDTGMVRRVDGKRSWEGVEGYGDGEKG